MAGRVSARRLPHACPVPARGDCVSTSAAGGTRVSGSLDTRRKQNRYFRTSPQFGSVRSTFRPCIRRYSEVHGPLFVERDEINLRVLHSTASLMSLTRQSCCPPFIEGARPPSRARGDDMTIALFRICESLAFPPRTTRSGTPGACTWKTPKTPRSSVEGRLPLLHIVSASNRSTTSRTSAVPRSTRGP